MNIFTDEDIKEIVGPWGDTPIKGYTRSLFDKIEAKLREKEVSNQVCDHGHLRRVCEICQRYEEIEQLKAERDALRAAAEKGTEYVLAQINQDLRAERDALQATLDDYMDDHKAVVNQQCAGDEVHCSCVPHLRKRIKEVEAERDAAVAVLETVLRIPSMSDADLEQLRINCKAAIDAARSKT